MRHALLLALLGLVSGFTAAQTGDPLETPRCRQAMQQLEREEAAASATARPGDATPDPAARVAIATARRDAAQACLGSVPDAIAPRSLPPPIAVPPIEAPRRVEPPRVSPAAPAPATRAPQPTTITTCDAIGCWTNDGTRLQRAGPNLLGPRGPCIGAGPVVSCP